MNPETIVAPDSVKIPVKSKNFTESGLFAPGNRANPGGRPKSRLFRKRSMRDLLRESGDEQRIDTGVKAIVDKMIAGDVRAFEALRDTVDGRPSPDNENTGNSVTIFAPTFIIDEKDGE